MIEAAMVAFWNEPNPNITVRQRMQAAIEAALDAREPVDAGELVRRLRGVCHEDNRICDVHPEAADAIEELVETIKTAIKISDTSYREAIDDLRSLLTRMGVKL